MKKVLLTVLLSGIALLSQAQQYCVPAGRFASNRYFSLTQIDGTANIVYGHAINDSGNNEALKLDLYYPKPNIDPLNKKPLIMMVHGGSFIGGDKHDLDIACKEFARRGFVVANINYRVGHDCAHDPSSYDYAVYRALQDAHAAMRFLVHNADTMHIDTSWIFVGGQSAGSGTVLGMVYIDQSEWNSAVPGIQAALGSLFTSGNNYTNTYDIKAIFNNWGGTPGEFMDPADMIPMVSFHGDADSVVDIDSAYSASCVNPQMVYGSRVMHELLVENGVCSELNVKVGGGHGVYAGAHPQITFRVAHASCFFKSLFCQTCTSSATTDSIPPTCGQNGPELRAFASEDEELSIVPNPATEQIAIHGIDPAVTTKVAVYNLYGQQLAVTANDLWEIRIDQLPAGIYVVRITQSDQIRELQFVKAD